MSMRTMLATPEQVARWRYCLDCGIEWPEDYQVTDALWAEAGLAPKAGRLCLGCLATRLIRPLTIGDFPVEIPINTSMHFGYNLGRQGYCQPPALDPGYKTLVLRDFPQAACRHTDIGVYLVTLQPGGEVYGRGTAAIIAWKMAWNRLETERGEYRE